MNNQTNNNYVIIDRRKLSYFKYHYLYFHLLPLARVRRGLAATLSAYHAGGLVFDSPDRQVTFFIFLTFQICSSLYLFNRLAYILSECA